jgi:FkbH-like protein
VVLEGCGSERAMIENKVKLVIWDLDETFWRGTLTEGGISFIDSNIEIVRELSLRGIVNSICSKNDFEQAKAKLVECGIWDHFVFPSIRFDPKGKAISEMIEGAALRPQNVLFLDDNPSNLEEARFFNPGIMAAHPADVLGGLLDHPNLAGKPDPELTRLKQYRFLQHKVDERSASDLSNEDFLRASNIRVRIDPDVEVHFDRVVELINRTNQLNFTKVRLETEEALQAFRAELSETFGMHAGCVFAVDNYGDYGLIGFYLGKRRARTNELLHFVFSCRTMNMGIEQHVYEMLGRPEIEIARPVSYDLDVHARIDWINAGDASGAAAEAPAEKLVLLGGCDLLQLASYCSTNRLEFVNGEREGYKIRFDDPGFILADRSKLKANPVIGQFPWWSHEDAIRFDEGIASAGLLLISLWSGMNGRYFQIGDGIRIRLTGKAADNIEEEFPELFAANFEPLDLDDSERLDMVRASFDAIAAKCQSGGQIFALGCYTRGVKGSRNRRRMEYNRACREYCERHPDVFRYVDVDAIVSPETLVNGTHFARAGYFAIAQHILDPARRSPDAAERSPGVAEPSPDAAERSLDAAERGPDAAGHSLQERNKARRLARVNAHQERRERARAERLAERNKPTEGVQEQA